MSEDEDNGTTVARRQLLVTGSAMMASCLTGASPALAGGSSAFGGPDTERPKKGDRLMATDPSPHAGKTITLDMLTVGGDMIPAWPHDPELNVTRSRARLNRLAVVRVDPETLDEKTRPNAAEGVLAFSSFCTHQGCTVGGWMPEGSLLACACHGSTFDVTRSGAVMSGPAKRRLAMLPLALEDGALVVAGAFTSKLGYT